MKTTNIFKLAIIGKPNVGKSSLFNRITKSNDAITSEVSGTTRDVKRRVTYFNDNQIEIYDTGGIDESSDFFKEVRKRALEIAKKSDLIFFMVDVKQGFDEEEKKLFYSLHKLNPKIILVINKADSEKEIENFWDYQSFGIENMFIISVLHNRGVAKLLEFLQEDILKFYNKKVTQELLEPIELPKDDSIKVAILGRVNVGKSSILNALTNTNRSMVSPIAGTTIDPVDEQIEYNDKKMTFVDTAGIRKRGKIEGIERHALYRTQKMLEVADVALLVLDVSTDFVELDEKIAGLIDKFGLATIIVLNKWDIKHSDFEHITKELRRKFKFLYFAPVITLSAVTKRNIDSLKDEILKVYTNYTKRLKTARVNELISQAVSRHKLPSDKGRFLKIYFSTQFEIKPPQIAVVMNLPHSLHFSYKRYLINFIRENEDFSGTPIRIFTRAKRSADEEFNQD